MDDSAKPANDAVACAVCGAEDADVNAVAGHNTPFDFARGANRADAQAYRVVTCRQCGVVYEIRDK